MADHGHPVLGQTGGCGSRNAGHDHHESAWEFREQPPQEEQRSQGHESDGDSQSVDLAKLEANSLSCGSGSVASIGTPINFPSCPQTSTTATPCRYPTRTEREK